MYGSVTAKDISILLFNEGVVLDKKHIVLHLPIKTLGTHTVALKLPENVPCEILIEIKPDRIVEKKKKKEVKAENIEGENLENSEENK